MKKIENVYYWNCRRLESLYGKATDESIISAISEQATKTKVKRI